MKHNKCVPIIRITLNKIKEHPLGNNGSWTNLLQGDIFSEYDKVGIKSKILYKVYHQIKKPIPNSACFNGMTQCCIMGHRCSLETLIRKCSRSVWSESSLTIIYYLAISKTNAIRTIWLFWLYKRYILQIHIRLMRRLNVYLCLYLE